MRITNSMMIDNMLKNLNDGMLRVNKYGSQLASNRKVVNLSDNPVGVLNSMNARNQIRRLQQYQQNVSSARSWTTQAETAMSDMTEIITKIKELVVDATGTKNESDKVNFATQIKSLTEHLIQTCNTTVGDKYIFSGFNSTKEGFKTTKDDKGNITGILYNGLDLTKAANDVLTGKGIANTTNASNFVWSGQMDATMQQYTVNVSAGDNEVLEFKDAGGNTVATRRVLPADIAAGKLDLTAEGLGVITWENKMGPAAVPGDPDVPLATADEIAGAIASAKSVTTPSAAVMGPKADAGLHWTGSIGEMEKYKIEVNGDTIVFKNSFGSEVLQKKVTAADLAAGSIDLSAQGLGVVSWDPLPAGATTEDLANLIGTAEFVTSKFGEEATQNIQFEIGYSMNFDVTFTGIDVVGTGKDNMFYVLNNLVNDLNNGAPNEVLTTYLTSLTTVQDRLITNSVELGTRSTKLDTMVNRYSLDAINYEAIRSDVEDIDQAQTIMNYKYCESIFKQALASGAQIIQPSLMDFLR